MEAHVIAEILEKYGFPVLAFVFLALLFYQSLYNKNKEVEQDLEDTKTDFKREENTGAFIRVLGDLTQAIQASTEQSKASTQAVLSLSPAIKNSEDNINTHIDNIINPYQDIHKGHTTKLIAIMETGSVLVEAVKGLKEQHLQQSETLEAILETVKLLAEDTAELDIITLSNDNHKEKTE